MLRRLLHSGYPVIGPGPTMNTDRSLRSRYPVIWPGLNVITLRPAFAHWLPGCRSRCDFPVNGRRHPLTLPFFTEGPLPVVSLDLAAVSDILVPFRKPSHPVLLPPILGDCPTAGPDTSKKQPRIAPAE